MANNMFTAVGITGGTAGKMDDIHHDNISAGDICLVTNSADNKVYVYQYDSGAQVADSGIDKIVPDSNGTGNGFWQLGAIQATTNADMRTFLASANLAAGLVGLGVAYDHMWLPAKAWTPHTTNGCAAIADFEETTNDDVMYSYLAFDGAADEFAGINIVMPPTWNRSTISAKFYWVPQTGCVQAETCIWQLQGISLSDDDNIDTTEFTDTGEVISDAVTAGVEDDLHITAKTPAITINGTPALEDLINLKVSRDANVDTMTVDAYLIGVNIEFLLTNKVTAWV